MTNNALQNKGIRFGSLEAEERYNSLDSMSGAELAAAAGEQVIKITGKVNAKPSINPDVTYNIAVQYYRVMSTCYISKPYIYFIFPKPLFLIGLAGYALCGLECRSECLHVWLPRRQED
jgi:hypothetical protein